MAGDLFFVSFMVFPVVLGVGFLFETFVVKRDLGVFNTIVNILTFIGVVFHELSHFIMCVVTGVPPKNIMVRFRDEDTGIIAPNGEVNAQRPFQITFLQFFLISFGPVLIGAWIFYFTLEIAFSPLFDPVYRIIAGFLAVATLLASTPSSQDFKVIKLGIDNDPRHALYQVFLLTLSILLSWVVVVRFQINFPVEFFYYFIIIGWYAVLKYSLIVIRWSIRKLLIGIRKDLSKSEYRGLTRKRYKLNNN